MGFFLLFKLLDQGKQSVWRAGELNSKVWTKLGSLGLSYQNPKTGIEFQSPKWIPETKKLICSVSKTFLIREEAESHKTVIFGFSEVRRFLKI